VTDTFSFKVGEFECLVVSDGTIIVPDMVTPKKFDPADPGSGLTMDVSCLLINTGKNRILVDTGCGPGFGPASGKLLANLQAAGVKTSEIDTIVITHAHSDHIGANVDARGNLVFENAGYVIHKAEWEYWMGRLQTEQVGPRSMLATTKSNLPPIKDRIRFVEDKSVVAPGVECVLTPGHTPGGLMLMVTSGKDKLCCIGDLIHHTVELNKPETFAIFDVARDEAIALRTKVLPELADSGVLIHSCHLDFPGLGHFVRKGKELAWQPIPRE
jgi:glyoxylase-like metal-dependent hydrolase (beta-lactamase superfamily II)